MNLTMNDYCMLVAGISFSACISYMIYEVINAIQNWYEEW
jgi:hypothetical protein